MSEIIGWYYLHTNGEMIYKRDLDGTVADIRESDFARHLWPMNPQDREGAWNICVEGLALGALEHRIDELATKWQCDDDDADTYAEVIGCNITRDGNMWCATRQDFTNLQESPAGFGSSKLIAMAELAKALGFRASKMWGATFKDLLKVEVKS